MTYLKASKGNTREFSKITAIKAQQRNNDSMQAQLSENAKYNAKNKGETIEAQLRAKANKISLNPFLYFINTYK
jgi:hypothetical protein